jgi:hypothetical protein
MRTQDIEANSARPQISPPPIRRLLMVADAAVAEVDELPAPVRAMIDAATEVYVITPSRRGRLDWLTDDVYGSRHLADLRLDSVLGHVRALGAHASGRRGDDIALSAFSDAVADFQPDHILIGLRSSEHANWQERGLIEHVSERFGLPVTSYAIDCGGHPSTPGA